MVGTHGTACGRYERLHRCLPGSRRAGKGDGAGPGGAAAPWACLCPLRGPHRGLPRILPAAPDPRPQPHPPAGEGAGRGRARKGCADVGLGTCSLAWQWWLPRRRDRQCVGPDGSRVLTILPPPTLVLFLQQRSLLRRRPWGCGRDGVRHTPHSFISQGHATPQALGLELGDKQGVPNPMG